MGLAALQMWDLPGPGLKPVSPALAGGFLTTVPPGKSLNKILSAQYLIVNCRHRVVEQVSRADSSCIAVTLYPLNRNSPFSTHTHS